MEWRTDGIKFYIDGKLTNKHPGDFSKNFKGPENPWASGTKMAPFDAPVINQNWSANIQLFIFKLLLKRLNIRSLILSLI